MNQITREEYFNHTILAKMYLDANHHHFYTNLGNSAHNFVFDGIETRMRNEPR